MITNISTLPPYTIRKSNRARYLQLKITAKGQLEVVVPKRTSQKDALAFLLENRDWINARRHLVFQPESIVWPTTINLRAIECEWPFEFNFAGRRSRVTETIHSLKVTLTDESFETLNTVIKRWLKAKAKLELTPWLNFVSRRCELPFRDLNFRGQKTMWGSCSRHGDISLNYKLLFLPNRYVEYVLVHELCHTVHFDHSRKFWSLVSRYVEDWQVLCRELRRADHFVPKWLVL